MSKSRPAQSLLLVVSLQLGLFALLVYYTFIGGQTALGIYDHTWRLVTLWLNAVVLGGWLLWQFFSGYSLPRTPLDLPLLFLLIAWLLAVLFSENRVSSREALVFFVTYLFFFYMAADLARWPWLVELILSAIVATAGLVWMLALLQLSWWYQDQGALARLAGHEFLSWLQRIDGLPRLSVLGNPNTMASYLALVIPVTLYKFTTVRTTLARLLLGLWLVMLAASILLSQSRGGILGLVFAVAIYVVVAIYQNTGRVAIWPVKSPAAWRSQKAWFVALAVLGLFAFSAWTTLASRGLSAGVSIRQQVIAGALKTWRVHPFLGSGPGTLGEQLVRYQQPLDTIWADAHNLFLTLAAETGLLGTIGLLWLTFTALKIMATTFRRVDREQWNMASMASAAALSGFAVHNMVDSLFKYPVIMLTLAILGGCWIGPYLTSPRPVVAARRYPALLLGAAAVIAVTVMGIRGVENIRVYNQAVAAASGNDWPAALAQVRLAGQLAPESPFYRRQLAFVLGYLAYTEPAYRPEAISRYTRLLQEEDRLAIDHAYLGSLLAADGQWPAAGREMALARELEPWNPLYRLNLGYILEMAGDTGPAWREYAGAIAASPDYLRSSHWMAEARRAAALPDIVDLAAAELDNLDQAGWLRLIRVYLLAGAPEKALVVYEQGAARNWIDEAARHREKGRILAALDRPAEAEAEFQAALALEPGSAETLLQLSQVAQAQNMLDRAAAYAAAALFLQKSPATLYQSAAVAAARGQASLAIEQYEAAFEQAARPSEPSLARYATEVARRRPLPAAVLPGLVWPYPADLLTDITLAEGTLLEGQADYERAGVVYRRLLELEPAVDSVKTRLAQLCRSHGRTCPGSVNGG